MIVPPKDRFDATADHYRQHRPGYPEALVSWVLTTSALRSPSVIADVGCGTGISTRAFSGRGFELVGVDPSEPMLEQARREGGARFQRGESTATGLGAGSVNLVISGQAFHWFDLAATLAELRRVLAPGGWCSAFWNLRRSTPFLDEYDVLLKSLSSEYEKVPKPLPTIAAIKARPEVVSVHEGEFPNSQELDRDGLLGRAFSSSYVTHGVEDRAGFERSLLALFDRHQVGGRVEFVYRTVAIAWRIEAS